MVLIYFQAYKCKYLHFLQIFLLHNIAKIAILWKFLGNDIKQLFLLCACLTLHGDKCQDICFLIDHWMSVKDSVNIEQ